jgi:hypothetical protein
LAEAGAFGGVKIVGLDAFRADLKAASKAGPRALTKGLRAAGKPVLERTRFLAPITTRKVYASGPHPGELKASYRIRIRGTQASIISTAPFGAGAEWGVHGRWRGFLRYPGAADDPTRGRFAWRAVLENRERIAAAVDAAMDEIETIYGWAHRSA